MNSVAYSYTSPYDIFDVIEATPSIPLVKWPVCPLCAAYGQNVPQTPYLHPIKLTTYWECEHHGHWRYVKNGWKRFFDPVNGPWGA